MSVLRLCVHSNHNNGETARMPVLCPPTEPRTVLRSLPGGAAFVGPSDGRELREAACRGLYGPRRDSERVARYQPAHVAPPVNLTRVVVKPPPRETPSMRID